MNTANRAKFLIVALDGGGVRCALQIIILKRLFTRFPQLEAKIRLVAGTSAGALVGAALGALGCAKMVEHMLAQSFAKKIFTESWAHEVRSMRGLYRSNYTNRELEKLLMSVFGSATALNHYCNNGERPDLLVTSFCIDTSDAAESLACNKCRPTAAAAAITVASGSGSGAIELKDIKQPEVDAKVEEAASNCCDNMVVDASTTIAATEPAAAPTESATTVASTAPPSPLQPTLSRWPTFLSNISSMLRWSKAPESSSPSAMGPVVAGAVASAVTRTAVIQEACNQQKQHQNPQHKCNCSAWHAQIYHTMASSGGDVTFVDVLLRSTSAPTYFPAHNGCVDGGVIAQNPSLFAITHALKYGHNADGAPLQLDDIVLLSIGTGSHPMNMNTYGKSADLGLAQWVPNLMCLFNDASLDATDINCRYLLAQGQYLRVQVRMPRAVDLANYNEWSELVLWAEQEPLDALFDRVQALFLL